MIPAPYDLEMYRGDVYTQPLRLRLPGTEEEPGDYLDLTGYTLTAQIRADPEADEALAVIAADAGDQETSPGSLTLTLSSEQTALLTDLIECPGWWDLQVTPFDTSAHETYLRGRVHVLGDVTR